MKLKNIGKNLICILLALTVIITCAVTAFAVDLDGDGIDDEAPATQQPTQAVTTQEPIYTNPPTQAPTEYVEPTTVYSPPTTQYQPIETTTEPYEPETYYQPETQATQAQTQQYVQNQAETEPSTTEFVAPTLAKTVSDKEYSTNYTAGIVSWICVAVGVLVIAVVMISTKAGGKKADRKRI